jgi:CHAD domain-containing protein
MLGSMDQLPKLSHSIRSVVLSQIDTAVDALSHDVHETRKRCKLLRAWLHLLEPSLGDQRRSLDHHLRDAARALAGQRQLDALREVCTSLADADPEHDWPALSAQLERNVNLASDDHSASLQALSAVRASFQTHKLVLTPDQLKAALLRRYRKARKLAKRCAQGADAETLHDWRKHIKYHGLQCEALAPLWPSLKQRHRQMRRLWTLLGDHQDLHELVQIMEGKAPAQLDAAEVESMLALLRSRQHSLARRAIGAGETHFAQTAKHWQF